MLLRKVPIKSVALEYAMMVAGDAMVVDQVGIWIIDAEAKTVFANDRMAEILGTSAPELMGRASFTYVFPEDVDNARRLFDAKKGGQREPIQLSTTPRGRLSGFGRGAGDAHAQCGR